MKLAEWIAPSQIKPERNLVFALYCETFGSSVYRRSASAISGQASAAADAHLDSSSKPVLSSPTTPPRSAARRLRADLGPGLRALPFVDPFDNRKGASKPEAGAPKSSAF